MSITVYIEAEDPELNKELLLNELSCYGRSAGVGSMDILELLTEYKPEYIVGECIEKNKIYNMIGNVKKYIERGNDAEYINEAILLHKWLNLAIKYNSNLLF